MTVTEEGFLVPEYQLHAQQAELNTSSMSGRVTPATIVMLD